MLSGLLPFPILASLPLGVFPLPHHWALFHFPTLKCIIPRQHSSIKLSVAKALSFCVELEVAFFYLKKKKKENCDRTSSELFKVLNWFPNWQKVHLIKIQRNCSLGSKYDWMARINLYFSFFSISNHMVSLLFNRP